MSGNGPVCWVDGRLQPRSAAAVGVDDSAFSEGRGCYTSIRVARGRPRFIDQHLRRLARGARALGLPRPDEALLRRALEELAHAAFGQGEGIVRLQLSRDGEGDLHVAGIPRGFGRDAPSWLAVTAPFPHPGCVLPGGHKLTSRLALALAGDAAREAGADEALLFDAAGRLVEGTRSNVVLLCADGRLRTPAVESGAVAGVALEVLLERLPDLERAELSRADLLGARGAAATNAVRGARALVSLDGEPLGAEGPALAERLDSVLDEEQLL